MSTEEGTIEVHGIEFQWTANVDYYNILTGVEDLLDRQSHISTAHVTVDSATVYTEEGFEAEVVITPALKADFISALEEEQGWEILKVKSTRSVSRGKFEIL
jgi:hypothetical protein